MKLRLSNFLPLFSKYREQQERIELISSELRNAIEFARKQTLEVHRMNRFLANACHASGGYMWCKDHRHRYVFANQIYCAEFLTPHAEETHHSMHRCTEEVMGFTDGELLFSFEKHTGKRHTFRELTVSTDEVVRSSGKRTHFIEQGYIGQAPMILHSVKTPLLDKNGAFDGTVAIGYNLSAWCDDLVRTMEHWEARGDVQKLAEGVYQLEFQQQDCQVLHRKLFGGGTEP